MYKLWKLGVPSFLEVLLLFGCTKKKKNLKKIFNLDTEDHLMAPVPKFVMEIKNQLLRMNSK